MPLPDVNYFADKVSYLLKTWYRDVQYGGLPFNTAFTRVMDEHNVPDADRYELKKAIGSILGKRPRKTSGPKDAKSRSAVTPTKLVVLKQDRAQVVLVSPAIPGLEITYRRRGDDGEAVWSAQMGHPSRTIFAQGAVMANALFEEMDREAVRRERIRVIEANDDWINLSVGRQFRVAAIRGKGGKFPAFVTDFATDSKFFRQRDIPAPLLADVRAVIKRHFKDPRTPDLFPAR